MNRLAIDIDSIHVIERFVGNLLSPTTQITETKTFPGKLNSTFFAYPFSHLFFIANNHPCGTGVQSRHADTCAHLVEFGHGFILLPHFVVRPRKASRERRQKSGSRGNERCMQTVTDRTALVSLRSRTSDRDKIPNLHCSGSYRHWHFLPDCDPERRSNPRWLFGQ